MRRCLHKVEKVAIDNQFYRVRSVRKVVFEEGNKMAFQLTIKVIQRRGAKMQIADDYNVRAIHYLRMLLHRAGEVKASRKRNRS